MDQNLYPGFNLTLYQKDTISHLIGILFLLGDIKIIDIHEQYDKKSFPKKEIVNLPDCDIKVKIILSRDAFDALKGPKFKESLKLITNVRTKDIL